MTTPKKYIRKPEQIEAMQLIGCASDTAKVCDWLGENGYPWLRGNARDPESLYDYREPFERPEKGIWISPMDGILMIRTPIGDIEAPWGSWIIKSMRGEIFICRDVIFSETYQEVEGLHDGWEESMKYIEGIKKGSQLH
jgi:hypothetical protein